MAAYAQTASKRQKVREVRVDNVDYFQGIDKIEYNNMASATETTSYRYYSCNERVHSRAMENWLKYSVSLTEFRMNGSDLHGRPSHSRPWDDGTNSIENRKRAIKALFDFCCKLSIKYWTAFDSDLIPTSDSWDENKSHWDDIVEYVLELTQKCHMKLLWLAPDLHSHSRYASGALTSHDANTFLKAASQIKQCLEMSQRLNAECFMFWPYREGYDSIFHADVSKEIKLFAKLLKITTDFKDRLSYRCQMLIMPYYGNTGGCENIFAWQHLKGRGRDWNSYMWDVTSCLYFLRVNNLDRYYKVCTSPGHHLVMANVYNMLGGVTITNDFDQYKSKQLTLMMKCIVEQGSAPPGGINLKLHPRRDSDLCEQLTVYIKYIDAIAKALKLACNIITDQVFSKHLQQHYSTYSGGFGARLMVSDVSMEECQDCYKKNQNPHDAPSSKYEHIDVVFQRYLDTCDHI